MAAPHPLHYCSACLMSLLGPEERCVRSTCGKPRPPSGWPQVRPAGEVIQQRYRLVRELGRGGAGVTYLAHDLTAPKSPPIALKILHEDRASGVQRERLRLEGNVLLRLRHPHIVEFRDLYVDGTPPYWLATTYVPSFTLARRLGEGPLDPFATLELGRQLASALEHAHHLGVVHRDLKPANILLKEGIPMFAQIVDFGIARAREGSDFAPRSPLTQLGSFLGTPEYAAPEQILAEGTVGPAADLFSLGVVLHVSAGGDPIRASLRQARGGGDSWRVKAKVTRNPLRPDPRFVGATRVLNELIGNLLAEHPDDRPTAPQVVSLCREALRTPPPGEPSSAPPPKESPFAGEEGERGGTRRLSPLPPSPSPALPPEPLPVQARSGSAPLLVTPPPAPHPWPPLLLRNGLSRRVEDRTVADLAPWGPVSRTSPQELPLQLPGKDSGDPAERESPEEPERG